MLRLLKFSSGLSLRGLLLLSALMLMASCSSPLDLLLGGPNVAANTQVGAENNQTVGVVTNNKPELTIKAPVEKVVQDTSTTNNTEVDPLLIILLVLGWLAPSPSEIGRGLSKIFRR